jgi:putative sterol carrier protein
MRYLSLEWIESLRDKVAASTDLSTLANDYAINVTQVVTDGPEGTITYHLSVGNGGASFGAGAAANEDVRMEQSWDTAIAIATGETNAQDVFINGEVRITGDVQKLIASEPVFAALDSVFEDVRAHTVYA